MSARQIVPVLIFLLVLTGCGKSRNPISPGHEQLDSVTQSVNPSGSQANRIIWGFWDISISADGSVVEILPDRATAMHLNTVRLLEFDPCHDCISVVNVQTLPGNILQADFRLRHPFPGLLKLTGFDVRGIFISEADYTWPESGRLAAMGDTVYRMLNPDGYTHLFNPTDFPEDSPTFPALKYIPGHHAPGGDLTSTLNPYVAYEVDQPRRMFMPGTISARTVQIHKPDGPLEFGYAVDACWQLVETVTDPVEDFPIDANCLEAYTINSSMVEALQSSAGSMAEIIVDVFDHQGLDTISTVTIEAPDLYGGTIDLSYDSQTSDESWQYSGTIVNQYGAFEGDYPILIRVTDFNADQNLGVVDAWSIDWIEVETIIIPGDGWALTWGGAVIDTGFGVEVDGLGNIYVTGAFDSIVDFDPGPGVETHSSAGLADVFLSKFDTQGNFQWVRTWGGPGDRDQGRELAISDNGDIYVCGWFTDTADFDPGPGIDEKESNGSWDSWLCKYNPDGDYLWGRTWGSNFKDHCYDVAVDGLGDVYVRGSFETTVDFDPGPGEEWRTSESPWFDTYMSKFNPDGEFQWVVTWGSSYSPYPYGFWGNVLAVANDNSIYAATGFIGSYDFDPGPGIEMHTSSGKYDAAISKFNSDGDFLWARSWGGPQRDLCTGVCVDNTGVISVTGVFCETVDFDPGPGIVTYTSNGNEDLFLARYNSTGIFISAVAWGGPDDEYSFKVDIDDDGNSLIAGSYQETVDFDPGPGSDTYTASGVYDYFITKYDSSGAYVWTRVWGSDEYPSYPWEVARGLAVDAAGYSYITGSFAGTFDFDPGPGIDEHSSNDELDVFLIKLLPDGYW